MHRARWTSFGHTDLSAQSVAATLIATMALVSGCVATQSTQLTPLPAVDADIAATVNVRSAENISSDIRFFHQLAIDGAPVARFAAEDTQQFTLAEGSYSVRVTCHVNNTIDGNNFPTNYGVVDGESTLDLDLIAGDEICLKISFNPLNCALVDEVAPSYCD